MAPCIKIASHTLKVQFVRYLIAESHSQDVKHRRFGFSGVVKLFKNGSENILLPLHH